MPAIQNANGTLNPCIVNVSEVKPCDRYGLKVIVVISEFCNGWAAFSAPTDWTDDQTARMGAVVPQEAAIILFPVLASTGRVYGNF
jgi:hypothetical protein